MVSGVICCLGFHGSYMCLGDVEPHGAVCCKCLFGLCVVLSPVLVRLVDGFLYKSVAGLLMSHPPWGHSLIIALPHTCITLLYVVARFMV